jgi:UPF0042 nucleotide-binding protein
MSQSSHIQLISFGYKSGTVPVSNLVFDVRFLKNPYWEENLRDLCGLDPAVREYVLSQPAAVDFLGLLLPFLKAFITGFQQSDASEFKIAFGCTGGQHRSVAIVEAVAEALQETFPGAISTLHENLQASNEATF